MIRSFITAPNQPPGFHRRGKPSLAIKPQLHGSAALGLLGCTWPTNTAVLQDKPQFEILTFTLRQPRTENRTSKRHELKKESEPILLAQLFSELLTRLANLLFLLVPVFSRFYPYSLLPDENKAERSYFLSFKNNGVTLCGFSRYGTLALCQKSSPTSAKNRDRFLKNAALRAKNIQSLATVKGKTYAAWANLICKLAPTALA